MENHAIYQLIKKERKNFVLFEAYNEKERQSLAAYLYI